MLTRTLLAACIALSCAAPAFAQAADSVQPPLKPGKHSHTRKQVGKASYYAHKFAGRKMADGTRMDPHSDNAASKTLPLGTRARVTNLDTGDSAEVTIRDRGPHVRGRIIDVSPATAQEIGLTKQRGVARVEVVPLTDSAAAGR
ncbi:septal ring lytic transglycosylase RlpA family protein [Caenimonas aquaedulcis]|uniref:Endolytic peptidoglycan transglycosylase RlpA n=1 Tax=Caenimonas aquaedulcis TaxID=2793270 RepID=A0A931H3A5_9BURK|nr:septal ring lytic transglycosylase RlpA family protein [Caenimonas aquaedulcis]MBG9387757.1 septal ring lytic transglycosylase RlpA family protein [Caenimonas aquaedulcis]